MDSSLRRYIILGLLGIALAVAIIIARNMSFQSDIANMDFTIKDQNGNFTYEVGEEITFDLTDSASFSGRQVVWYFGDGRSVNGVASARYKFKEPGTYLITMEIDDRFRIDRPIDIIAVKKVRAIDSVARIIAPTQAYVNEEVIFQAVSTGARSWYWEFGATGFIDSYDEHAVYIYETPDVYEVSLKTDLSQYPTYHRIKILPPFEILPPNEADSMTAIAQDIKEHLQAISNASYKNKRAFYQNLDYIISSYITCYKADEVTVVVNETNYNDLYSYCQGLHFLERKNDRSVRIDWVGIDTLTCGGKINISKIKVTQSAGD